MTVSYLTTSESTMLTGIVDLLVGQGYPFDPLTTTFNQYLATVLSALGNDPVSHLRMSETELLAGIVNVITDGSVSHLTTSRAELLSLAYNAVEEGLGGGELARLPLNSTVGFLGHSRFATRTTRGIPQWIMARCNGRYHFHAYAIQARDGINTTAFLAILPTLLAINPAVVVIAPPVNDLGVIPYATIQSNYEAMIALCRAAGARIIIENEPPSSNHVGGADTDRLSYNAWLQTIVSADLKVADWVPLVDMENLDQSYDAKHFTQYGAWLGSEADAEILLNWIDNTTDVMVAVDTNTDTMFGANFNTETDMGGTTGTLSGGATGTLFTGGTNQHLNGVTCVFQASDDPAPSTILLHGEKAQKMTLSGTSANGAQDCNFRRSQTFSIVAADYPEAFAWGRITAADGVSPPANLRGFALATGNFGRIFDEVIATDNGPFRNVVECLFRTNPFVATIQASSITTEMSTRCTTGEVPDAALLMSGLRIRLCERRAYGIPRDQSIPGDGGAAIYAAASATPTSGAAGQAFSSTPGNVSGGGWYANSPVPGSVTYQWKKASDNSNVGVGTGETTRTWTSTGAPAGSYYCAITWTNALGTITVNSNNVTVT